MAAPTKSRARVIEHGPKFKIIVMESPTEQDSAAYIQELKDFGVTDLVRTCEPTYSPEKFVAEGIAVHEMQFADGQEPPEDTLAEWNKIISKRYNARDPKFEAGMVAVHCVAGLGRAPVMAAVALIEMTGIDPFDAVTKIREKQKGAINARQLKFLQDYKKTNKKGGGGDSCTGSCAVM